MAKKNTPTFVTDAEGNQYAVNRKARRMALAKGMNATPVPMESLVSQPKDNGETAYFLSNGTNGLRDFTPPHEPTRPTNRYAFYTPEEVAALIHGKKS